MTYDQLPPWEAMQKRLTWQQLGVWEGKRVLDFGSGYGITAAHYAADNEVTAIEPSEEILAQRCLAPAYCQLTGSLEALRDLPSDGFDLVLCHNVLEYVPNKMPVVRELARVLKPGGTLSLLKHNRAGRVMQRAVLLDDLDGAERLLSGADDASQQFGPIRYYEDDDPPHWADELHLRAVYGMRVFWDLQQKQARHADAVWQERMLRLESLVAALPPYCDMAFFHHLLLTK